MTLDARTPQWEIDLGDEPYAFYILGVWRKEDGFYISTDSGCSCPTPFESHSFDDHSAFTGPLTIEQIEEEAMSLAKDYYSDGVPASLVADIAKLVADLREFQA